MAAFPEQLTGDSSGGGELTFVVDEEKRRTWNHGWWKSWTQGKVLIALALVGVVSFLLMLPYHIQCFAGSLTLDSVPMGAAREEVAMRFAVDVVVAGVQVVLMACGVPVLSYRKAADGAFLSETLLIEDGLLRWVRLSNCEHDGEYSLLVTVCKIDACSFSFDEKTRMLVVSAGGEGSMGWGMCDSADVALTIALEKLEEAGTWPYPREMEFYPCFDSDPVEYLRGLGVEVA